MSRKTRNQRVCQYCHDSPPLAGRKGCGSCLFRNRQVTKQRRQRHLSEGLCQYCGDGKHVPKKKGCRACLNAAQIKSELRREAMTCW